MKTIESTLRRPYVVCLFLALATAAVYAQAYRHSFFVLDDDDYVTRNVFVQRGVTWGGIQWAATTNAVANWHPVTWISHMVDCQLFGMNAGRHHLVNVLFHIVNTILLFLLLRRMTKAFWPSAFVAAIFALHPLHVESVVWIAERKDVLSTFFGLLALMAYTRYAKGNRVSGNEEGEKEKKGEKGKRGKGERDGRASATVFPSFTVKGRGLGYYGLAFVFLALGLMAKPMLVTWPFVLLLLDYWPLSRLEFGRGSRSQVKLGNEGNGWKDYLPLLGEKIPLFTLAVISSHITFVVQQKGGAVRSLESIPFWARLGNIAVSYIRYALHAFIPTGLVVYYPHPGVLLPLWEMAGAFALLAGLTVAIVWWLRPYRYLTVGWLWFLGTLVPVIGVVQVGSQGLADRYMYIPLIGLAIMVAWGVPELVGRWPHARPAMAVAAYVVIVALGAATFAQVGYWRDDTTLFARALAVTGTNDFTQANLGIALYRQGKTDEAETHFTEAVALRPHYTMVLVYLGIIKANAGKYDDAIKYYEAALECSPSDPAYVDAQNNIGSVFFMQRKYDEAIKHYLRAVDMRPMDADAHYNLGNALATQGKTEEAAVQYRMALGIRPNHERARTALGQLPAPAAGAAATVQAPAMDLPKDADECYKLGNTLAEKQKYAEAAAAFQQAVRLKPDFLDARINLGNSLAVQGKLMEAVPQFEQALKMVPDNPGAHANLGNALSELGKYDEAAAQFTEAVRLNPRSFDACFSLGWVQAKRGKLDDAARYVKRALAIDPKSAKARDALNRIETELNRK